MHTAGHLSSSALPVPFPLHPPFGPLIHIWADADSTSHHYDAHLWGGSIPYQRICAINPSPQHVCLPRKHCFKRFRIKAWQGLIDRLKYVPPGLAFLQKLLEQGSYMKGVVPSHYVHANQRQKLVKPYSRFFLCAHI